MMGGDLRHARLAAKRKRCGGFAAEYGDLEIWVVAWLVG
jgi:hypothetical protein